MASIDDLDTDVTTAIDGFKQMQTILTVCMVLISVSLVLVTISLLKKSN